MKLFNIILGSSSTERYNILKELPEIHLIKTFHPNIDEKIASKNDNNPDNYVLNVSLSKASEIMTKFITEQLKVDYDILVTCDQVVYFENEIIGKPSSFDEFINNYNRFTQKNNTEGITNIELVGAIVLTNIKTGNQISEVSTSKFYFKRPFTSEELISLYPACLSSCGGIIIESPLIKSNVCIITGSIESIKGLSVDSFRKLLSLFS